MREGGGGGGRARGGGGMMEFVHCAVLNDLRCKFYILKRP